MTDKKVLSKFQNALKKENLKLTKQRLSILDNIVSNTGHRECDEIYDQLKADGKNVSRATVYRTVSILEKYGIVRKLELGDGRARYEYKYGQGHHDHMICVETGEIIEFMSDEIEEIQDKIAKENGFEIIKHIHQLFVKPIKK
ncbi:MAG: transcriptional repressor [Candidatus Marinimicrobia bacterium]|nr:transcriptional repressor [Candidatus Neomarinimicrobiota bacterium]